MPKFIKVFSIKKENVYVEVETITSFHAKQYEKGIGDFTALSTLSDEINGYEKKVEVLSKKSWGEITRNKLREYEKLLEESRQRYEYYKELMNSWLVTIETKTANYIERYKTKAESFNRVEEIRKAIDGE